MRNKLIKNKHGTLIEIDREIKQERKRMKKPRSAQWMKGFKEGVLLTRDLYRHR